jgi:hypothetical protein
MLSFLVSRGDGSAYHCLIVNIIKKPYRRFCLRVLCELATVIRLVRSDVQTLCVITRRKLFLGPML